MREPSIFPRSRRSAPERPEIADDLRVPVEGSYLILYRIQPNSIEIVRVVRDLESLP